MITPTITSHWFDLKRQHVVGYFGMKAGDTYLQNEDGAGLGTKVQWPTEVKTNRSLLSIVNNLALTNSNGSFTPCKIIFYYQGASVGVPGNNDPYMLLADISGTPLADNTDLSARMIVFYAVFPKF